MIAAIMQPTYLPWIGYFDLIDQADVFILLDNVQFAKRTWQQRNRIKTPKGLDWLTIPAVVSGKYQQLIREVEIHDRSFAERHAHSIRCHYARAEHFKAQFPPLEQQLLQSAQAGRLLPLNHNLIAHFCRELNIQTPLLVASDLKSEGQRSALLASLCKTVGADYYLSAAGSAAYLLDEIHEFSDRGIAVGFHHYEHPEYRQLFPPFLPYAAIVDLALNEGPRSLEVLRAGRRPNFSHAEMADEIKRIAPNRAAET